MSKYTNSALECNALERLRTGNPTQNFSAILNSPETPVSYYQGFKNMLYYSVYADETSFDFELSKDIEKFSTVNIGSPRSLSSGHSSKISLKELLNENMDLYINAIKPEYEKFKVNHYHPKKSADNNSNSHNKNSNANLIGERNQIYQSNLTVLKSIEKEFTIKEREFKIQKELLSQKKEFICNSSHELIEKCGKIELELEKTLDFSHKMTSYISFNLAPLEVYVNDLVIRISKWKEHVNVLKQSGLNNSTQLLLKGIKAKNNEKVLLHLDKLNKLKDIIDLLKVLSTNSKKYKLVLELITKGKEIIDKLRIANQPSLKLLSLFEEEFNEYSLKCCEQINTEFNSALVESFKDFVKFNDGDDEESNNSNAKEQYDIDKYSYEKLLSSSADNSNLLNKAFFPIANTSKIKQMIQCFISTDVIDALCIKIRSLMLQVANDAIKSSVAFIEAQMSNGKKNSVILENNKATVTIIPDIEKNEQITLLIIIKCKEKLILSIKSIYNTIEEELNEVATSYKGVDTLKKAFQEEFNAIDKEIEISCYKIIDIQLAKCLQEALSHSNIDAFVDNYYLVKDIIKSQFKQELNMLFEKSEGDYLQKWLNTKESKFKSPLYENWEDFEAIPFNYQSNLDMILNFQLAKDQNKTYVDYIKEFQDQDAINSNNTEQVAWLVIKGAKIKANQCSLDVVKATFEVIKMLILFSTKSWNTVICAYTTLLRRYLAFQKEQIFEGRYSSVTQTEISMAYSISYLIQEITSSMLHRDTKKLLQANTTYEVYDNFKEDLMQTIKNMLNIAKAKILDLIDKQVIENSLKELYAIKLPHYPISEGEVPINSYALSLVKLMHSIYESMVNSYDNDFIIKTVIDALNKFFDKFEKYIFNGEKIVKEGSLKQFRRDMIFLKKNFGYLNIIDINSIKLRIDNINKTVLPEAVRVTTTQKEKEKEKSAY